MKKQMKPFAVELRRTGKKIMSRPAHHILEKSSSEPALIETLAVTAWPVLDEAPASEARRAADALFQPTAPMQTKYAASSDDLVPAPVIDMRRILPSLDEPDYLARLLQEEEARRPKRGRKPGSGLAPVRQRVIEDKPPVPAPEPAHVLHVLKELPRTIKGYMRGRILARYVHQTEPVFGQYWRKRPKPA